MRGRESTSVRRRLRALRQTPICLLVGIVMLPALALAQPAERQGPDRAKMPERFAAEIEEVKARLDLTEDQEVTVRPIIEGGLARGWALAQSYGLGPGGRPTMQQLLSLQGASQQILREMEDDLGQVLTTDQMKEYMKIRQEWQEKAMAQLRTRMGGD